MSKIFVSHSSKDNIFTRKLASSLSDWLEGDIWVDFKDNPAGIRWNQGVQKGLDECEIMILVVSPEAILSKNVGHEWHNFLNKNKTVIPIVHKPVKSIPYELESIVHIIFHRRSYKKAFAELCINLGNYSVQSKKVSLINQVNQNKTGNLFWLCHDLLELHRWLLQGISKEWIDVGFRQSCHHAHQIGIDRKTLEHLQNLRDSAAQYNDSDWTDQNRTKFADEVKIVFNVIAQEAQATDPNFDSGPG